MANSISAYTPQLWSRKGVALLHETIVAPGLVRVDFSEELAQAGDIVNTRQVGTFTAGTVSETTGVSSVQDASATNIAVQLTNWKDVTFAINDREAGRSFTNLVEQFLEPAMLAIANDVDAAVLGLYSDLTENTAVTGVTSGSTLFTGINTARTRLNKALVPMTDRVIILSDDDEGALVGVSQLEKVNEAGTSETLRNGQVGRLKGFDLFRASNVVDTGSSPATHHNIAMHRNCMALVTRPMATATGQSYGAVQTRATDPDAGISMRVTLSYDPDLLSTQVTCDILYGVKTLDPTLGIDIQSTIS